MLITSLVYNSNISKAIIILPLNNKNAILLIVLLMLIRCKPPIATWEAF